MILSTAPGMMIAIQVKIGYGSFGVNASQESSNRLNSDRGGCLTCASL